MNIRNKLDKLKLFHRGGDTSSYSLCIKRTSFAIFIAFLTVSMNSFSYANETIPALEKTNLILPDLAGKTV
ncbi:MAG: hypothetical protein GY817_00645, partial [bacterium]|nr:hypothetical protein [bacterium]